MIDETTLTALFEAALTARAQAYAPYSGFAVGAALPGGLDDGGEIGVAHGRKLLDVLARDVCGPADELVNHVRPRRGDWRDQSSPAAALPG